MNSVKGMILDILTSEGNIIPASGEDVDLREYIMDSIQFINFVVELEKKFSIEIPEEYLNFETISSLNKLKGIVEMLIEASNRS